MIVTRYTEWDGTQKVHLDAERVFDQLARYLSETENVQEALDFLLRHGFEWEGVQVIGWEDLLAMVREQIEQRLRDYDLRSALDDARHRLDELIESERDKLRERVAEQRELERKLDFLDGLSPLPGTALQQLRDYQFEDEDAAEEFQYRAEELEDAEALERFFEQYGSLFRGKQPLSYEDAVELMHEFQRLKELEEHLAQGQLDRVDVETLRELLGVEAVLDFQRLRQMQALLEQAGYLLRRGERVQLSPKGVRRLGQLALRDIYQGLLRDRAGGHGTDFRGQAQMRPESTHRLQFGDPMYLDLVQTLKNAVARRPGTPVELEPGDFEVFSLDHSTTTSTVLLLDMSWSMSWEGRFSAAKRVALALEELVRTRFPRDYLGIVGFYTRAVEIRPRDLPEVSWNMGDPFTNLQDGLRLATRLLDLHPAANRHMIVITDGQPTAYFSRGRLYCEWPLSFGGISMRAAQETLREVERVTRKGIVINTFMLDDSPALRAFVERMTRINRGRALYTDPAHLGQYLLVDYLGRKRKRV